jgi:dTDP-4-amino-4,6-dideoxygalactose transaminase
VTCGGPGGGLAAPRGAVVLAARDLAGHDEKEDDRPRVNGLMGDLHAAIGAVQIGRLDEFRRRREAIAARYDAAFADLPLGRPSPPPDSRPIAYRYLARAPRAERLIEALNRRGIMARHPVFLPLHRALRLAASFPQTDRAHSELVSLPIHPAMTDAEVDRVVVEVRRCLL